LTLKEQKSQDVNLDLRDLTHQREDRADVSQNRSFNSSTRLSFKIKNFDKITPEDSPQKKPIHIATKSSNVLGTIQHSPLHAQKSMSPQKLKKIAHQNSELEELVTRI
jgi:hypothetical protein